MTVSRCKHCKVEVVKVNFALGSKIMHNPTGRRFDQYEFCKRTAAEVEK